MADAPSAAVPAAAPAPQPGPSVFVCYASSDRPRALPLIQTLEAAGIGVWIDVSDITGGHSYGPEIIDGIRDSSAMLLLCSAAALSSRNVRQEIKLAWRLGRPILPLRLEPVEFPDSVAYWLEGTQWVDILEHSPEQWLPAVLRALTEFGLPIPGADAVAADPPERRSAAAAPAPAASQPVPAPAATQSTPVPVSTLPLAPTALLGREQELADLRRHLDEGDRLLTLTGPGGSGKTRLALELARAAAPGFGHGAVFVNLAPVADPALVLPAIAEALGVREAIGQSLAEHLGEVLHPRHQLLVLDNFEHLLPAAREIAALLASAPKLVILVTSRAPLEVRGEQEVVIGPLAVPPPGATLDQIAASPAIRLFLDRAEDRGTEVELSEATARVLADIVRRLEGLPLAIELAAVRIKLFPPETLLARLDRRLPLLTGGARDLPARQQTLRRTIAWSYDLLSPDEQALLRRLAVCAGGSSFEAVEAVAAAEGEIDVFDGLAALIRQSLLRQVHSEGEPRFSMLETIREFATEQLEASGEAEAVRRRHAHFFVDLVEQAEPPGHELPDVACLNLFDAEHDNLRGALAWTIANDPALALRLGGALRLFWDIRGHLSEGRAWLSRALAAGTAAAPAYRAKALRAAGDLAEFQRDFGPATAALEEALAIFLSLGDREIAARVLLSLGHVAIDQRDYETATARYTESIALWRELGDEQGAAIVTTGLGTVAFFQGDYERAMDCWSQAAAHFRTLGDTRRLGVLLNNLGSVALESGELERAESIHTESLALGRELGDQSGIAASLANLGMTAELLGDQERARTLLEESVHRYRELGIPGTVTAPLYVLAWVAREQGDLSLASARIGEAVATADEAPGAVWIGDCFDLVAALAADLGQAEQGARLLGMVAAMRETLDSQPGMPARTYHKRAVTAVQRRLSDEALAHEMAAGSEMPREEALAITMSLATAHAQRSRESMPVSSVA